MNTFIKNAKTNTIPRVVQFFLLWLLLTGALTLIVMRRRDISQPFAEDGSDLIPGALVSPLNLFSPIVDAVFVLPRAFATIATSVGLLYAPAMLSLLVIATASLAAVYCCRPSFSSIAPGIVHRMMLALCFIGGMGSFEVLGFGMGVTYVFSLLLVVLALEDPTPRSTTLVLLVLVLSFSTNFSFVAAPLFFIRGITTRNRALILSGLIAAAPVPLTLAVGSQCPSPTSLPSYESLRAPVEAIIDHTVFFLFAVPFVGNLMNETPELPRAFALATAVATYYYLWKGNDPRARLVATGLVGAMVLYIGGHVFGRAYSFAGSITDFNLRPVRSSFFLVPCSLMAWSVLLHNRQNMPDRTRHLFFLFLVSIQFASIVTSPIDSIKMPERGSWEGFATRLEQERGSISSGTAVDTELGPVLRGGPWGHLHCDTSSTIFIECTTLRGNHDRKTYRIPRSLEATPEAK